MAADLVIKNGWVVTPDATFKGGVAISGGKIVAIGADDSLPQGKEEIDVKGKHILPGLFDGHVHFREPGMTHKEDFNTGSTAAVCGGITTVVDMPNTVPPTADAEQVKIKKELGEAKSLVDFWCHRRRGPNQHKRHFADGRRRRHRLQDLLRRDHW
jgi:dihydroorotase